jgi:HAE1 family hydrophobic/amphiphilic exporter-1
VAQALYTWGQVGAAIRAAEVGLLTATDELRIAQQAAALNVTSVFYDVLLAKELNALALQNLEQKQRHLDEAQKKYAAGVATDYDVLASEVAVENARPEALRTENLIRISRDRLKFALPVEDREVDAQGSLDVTPAPYPTYGEALDSAVKNRPELSKLRHTIGVYQELVTIAEAGDKPRLDFKGGVGWQNLDPDGGPAESGANWNAGVYATFPLFDGLRSRGRVAQAESEAASLRIDERKLLDSIALSVRDAENSVLEAEGILKSLGGTVTQAERLLTMAEKGYEYGVKTKLEVDDAQLNLTTARSNLAKARRDYLVARATLKFVMGIL